MNAIQANQYAAILYSAAKEIVGQPNVSGEDVRGLDMAVNVTESIIGGHMTIKEALEYVNDKEFDGMTSIKWPRRILKMITQSARTQITDSVDENADCPF